MLQLKSNAFSLMFALEKSLFTVYFIIVSVNKKFSLYKVCRFQISFVDFHSKIQVTTSFIILARVSALQSETSPSVLSRQ